MKTSALVLASVLVSVSGLLVACGDGKSPSPSPAPTTPPASTEGGASSTNEGPKTTSNGTSGSPDGGVKGDAGYFAGGSRLPQ